MWPYRGSAEVEHGMRGKLWLGIGLSLVLLWLAFRGVNLDAVLGQLG